jgi:cytochrome c
MSNMPGTKMAYPGLQSADDRANVIAYLATINADGTVAGESVENETNQSVDSSAKSLEPRPLAIDVAIPTHGILHLGRTATTEEIAAWDIDIRPDGVGLPTGSGSAVTGGEIYDVQCASCHGVFGEGEGRWPILAGGIDTLTEERPEKTVGSYWPYLSTVFDYVRRAMPFGNSRSLSDDDVYALTAYLLYLNDLVDESFELTDQNFGEIRLPNEEKFIADNRDKESWYGGSDQACMSDCIEGVAKVTQRARVLDVTPETDSEESGGID